MRLDGGEVRHYWSDRVRRGNSGAKEKKKIKTKFFAPEDRAEASYCTRRAHTRPLLLARNWIRRHYASLLPLLLLSPRHSSSFSSILSVFFSLRPCYARPTDDGNNLDPTATLYVLIVFSYYAAAPTASAELPQ